MSKNESQPTAEELEAEHKREIELFQEYRKAELALVEKRKEAILEVEDAKENLKNQRSNLEALEKELARLVEDGPMKQEDLFKQQEADEKAEGERGEVKPEHEKHLPPVIKENVINVDPEDAEVSNEVEIREAKFTDKQMMVGDRKLATLCFVYNEPFITSHIYEPNPSVCIANCLKLCKKKDWEQLYQSEYGEAILKEIPNEKNSKRLKGGPYCGLQVSVGNSKYIICPQSEAVQLNFSQEEEAATA